MAKRRRTKRNTPNPVVRKRNNSSDRTETQSDIESRDRLLSEFCFIWESLIKTDLKNIAIAQEFERRFCSPLNRQKILRIVREAGKTEWLRFVPPIDYGLARQLGDKFGFLSNVIVVPTNRFEDVALRAGEHLLKILCTCSEQRRNARVHVGFAGGYSMRSVALALAELLQDPSRNFPQKLVLHALVTGFQVAEPKTDPNAFFSCFLDGAIRSQIECVGFHSVPIVPPDRMNEIEDLPVIREAFERRNQIDVIVTSASRYTQQCTHSQLYNVLNRPPPSGYRCDLLWQPLGDDGPLIDPNGAAVTLFKLRELPDFIERNKRVLLVLGPCAKCNQLKSDVLKSILLAKPPLITDLVIDSRSAADVLRDL